MVLDMILALLAALEGYAWPLVVLILALLFRKDLAKLVARINAAKLPGGGELSFDKALREAEEVGTEERKSDVPRALPPPPDEIEADESEAVPGPPPSVSRGDRLNQQELMALARTSPSATVVLAFKQVEHALQRVAQEEGLESRPYQLGRIVDQLVQVGRIGRHDAALLHDLRQLRNAAAHHEAADIDYGGAVRYVRLVDDLLQRLARLVVTVRNNAIVGGQFPPGGPWRRDGEPRLEDGDYEIVRRADGAWYLLDDQHAVVFRPIFDAPDRGSPTAEP